MAVQQFHHSKHGSPLSMSQFQSSECADFFEHWTSLRVDGKRTASELDFLNTPHPKFTPHLYITEASDSGMIIRHVGTKLAEAYGRNKIGEVLGQDQPANFRVAINTNSRMAISTPCGLYGHLVFETQLGSTFDVETLALPLSAAIGQPDRLVTYTYTPHEKPAGDTFRRYVKFPSTEWVDVGAGVPPMNPLSDGS